MGDDDEEGWWCERGGVGGVRHPMHGGMAVVGGCFSLAGTEKGFG